MVKFKVVITDHRFKSLDEQRRILNAVGAEIVEGQCKTEDEVISLASDADAVLNNRAPITRHVIEELRKCQVIVRYGIGTDTIDIDAATQQNILVANVPDFCVEEVSDHALTLLLACARGLFPGSTIARSGTWQVAKLGGVMRLRGKKLGLIGFGKIGQALARKAIALDLQCLTTDPFVTEEQATSAGVQKVSLERLLEESDYISIHAPLTKDTEKMLGEDQFAKMKRSAFVINVSRGRMIDQPALCRALGNGLIAGAALDVLEKEPPRPDDPILQLDNVILTPHSAWYSLEAMDELQRKAAEQVAMVLGGGFPSNLLNRELLVSRAVRTMG